MSIDPTGHLTAQFPELDSIISSMEGAPGHPVKVRYVRVKFTNGVIVEGQMRTAQAERFIDDAAKSSNVASYSLGEEI